MQPFYSVEQTRAILERVGNDSPVTLTGGQAIALWAEWYLPRAPELEPLRPLNSRDVDFAGTKEAARACAERLGARLILPEADGHMATPNSAIILFCDVAGVEHKIDIMGRMLGVELKDVEDTAIPVDLLDVDGKRTGLTFPVMSPPQCLFTRVANTAGLGRTDEHSLNQLRASIACTREFIVDWLVTEAGGSRPTSSLKLAEAVFDCALSNDGKEVFRVHGLDPFDAVPRHPGFPQAFREKRYPQMRAELARRRR